MEFKTIGLAILIILSCMVFPVYSMAGTDEFRAVEDLNSLVKKLNDHSATIVTIQSSFIQKKQLDFLDETIVSKGKFWFRKENQLRWAYEEPFEYEIIINGGKFQIKDGESVSAYDIDSNEAFREINDLIIGMVQGRILEEHQFEMQAYENSQFYLVKLVPGDPNMRKVISDMDIYFSKGDLTVSEIIMRESETDYTVITFFDKRFNETIPDPVFSTDL